MILRDGCVYTHMDGVMWMGAVEDLIVGDDVTFWTSDGRGYRGVLKIYYDSDGKKLGVGGGVLRRPNGIPSPDVVELHINKLAPREPSSVGELRVLPPEQLQPTVDKMTVEKRLSLAQLAIVGARESLRKASVESTRHRQQPHVYDRDDYLRVALALTKLER